MKECSINNNDNDCEKALVKVFDNLDEEMKKFRNKNGEIIKWEN